MLTCTDHRGPRQDVFLNVSTSFTLVLETGSLAEPVAHRFDQAS